ncbi:MAG: MCE family protein [Prolixibacteraceae bacterium]|nr:MCE family protein [Prolixibacteraceae bacterium]
MGNSKNKILRLGLLVASGLFLFIITIYFLGSKQNLFSSTVTVKSYFNNVKGLVEGNKVRYSGITIGNVAGIEIVSDSTILVEMMIDKDVKEFIRKDSRVKISSDGLMGSKIIEIQPGSSGAGSINDEDVLTGTNSVDIDEVLQEAKNVMHDGKIAARNLMEISEKMNNGEGDFAVLLNENNITAKLNKVGNEMLDFGSSANEIIEKVNSGEGDLGKLISDTTITSDFRLLMNKFDSITQKMYVLADELQQYSKQMNSGNGILYKLAYDSVMANKIDTTVAKVSNGVDNVVGAAETVENSWIFNLFSKNKKRKSK